MAQGLLAVGEAPGRLGADRTGTPFDGDRSAANFNRLLLAAGIDRESLFVANAVACNPRTVDGRNDRPSAGEIRNCSRHLERLIAILDPRVIVTLGRVALHALDQIHRHDILLKRGVGIPHTWSGRALIPLYHPGPRAMIHRPFEQQVADYRAVKQYALAHLT
jgi:uracil-DNA glycosylase family 4